MSANENLLIDLNNSPSNDLNIKIENPSTTEKMDTLSLMHSSIPIYQLLNFNDAETPDASENNPFDKMDKQAGLFNDPFEIVSNAVRSNTNNRKCDTNENGDFMSADVETGTLILIDSPKEIERDRNVFFSSHMENSLMSASMVFSGTETDLMTISPISSRSNTSKRLSLSPFDTDGKSGGNCSQSSSNLSAEQTLIKLGNSPGSDPSQSNSKMSQKNSKSPNSSSKNNNAVHNSKRIYSKSPTSSDSSGGQSAGGRNTGRTKSNSLNLLKYSLSNSRGEAGADGSPSIDGARNEISSSSNSRFNQMSRDMPRSGEDDSFEDLSATKPNWIDSETDIDLESDADSDLEKLNIPMLNRSFNELELKIGSLSDGSNDFSKKCSTPATNSNRDKLLKKFESIKHKIPSPPDTAVKIEEEVSKPLKQAVKIAKQLIDEAEPRTPPSQFSAVPDSVKTGTLIDFDDEKIQQQPDSANLLIQNLKKFVEQCDDKVKQQEANNLLKSLGSILADENNQQKNHQKKFEETPPQPIIRQGTFNIDKTEKSPEKENSVDDSKMEEQENEKEVRPDPNPGLSNVLKELQQVLGVQSVNVLQTNIQAVTTPGQGAATNANPTYIVLMGAPSADELAKMQETPNELGRAFRSQSLSAKDRPLAAIRAAEIRAEIQKQEGAKSNIFQTPKRSSISRRSSFGTTATKEPVAKAASVTVVRRRSIQGPSATPLAKSRLSPSYSSHNSPYTSVAKRRSLLGATSSSMDSPQKVKTLKPSYGTIMKPPLPPTGRNLKIRVKESLAGRSTAPMKATVPMNRANPLLMINESVSPIAINRKSLITNISRVNDSPAASAQPFQRNMRTIRGIPRMSSLSQQTAAVNAVKSKQKLENVVSAPTNLGRRRSISDYRNGTNENSSGAAKLNENGGLAQSGLNRFAPTRTARLSLQRNPTADTRSKENKMP